MKRLINITRPVDLPPLKNVDECKPDVVKKKPALPLFGKKGTFGFGKSATKLSQAVAPSKPVKRPIQSTAEEFVEEFDEDEEIKPKVQKITEKLESTSSEVTSEPTHLPQASSSKESECDIVAVSSLEDKGVSQNSTTKIDVRDKIDNNSKNTVEPEKSDEPPTAEGNSKAGNKKKRNRIRARDEKPRENIDIDDADEVMDTEKYAGWIPPENQSGDGIIDLNSKYGY